MRHLSTKIAVVTGFLATIIMISFTVFVFFSVTNFQREAEESSRERLLANYDHLIQMLVESVVTSVEGIHQRYIDGDLTLEEAQELARVVIREARYGESGYFWADRTDGIMIAHHFLRNNEGADRSNLEDVNGTMIIQNILDVASDPDGGFTEYWFPKEEGGEPYPKRAYSLAFEPYDWVISTGNYYDEIDEIVAEIRGVNRESLTSLTTILIAFSVFAIIAFVAVVFVLGRRLTMPLRTVEASLNEIAGGAGNLTQRVAVVGNDEVGRVAASFDRFVEALQEMIEGIKKSVQTLRNLGMDLADNSNETAAAINQITANIESVKTQVYSQEEQVSTTATSVEELTRNIDSLKSQMTSEHDTLLQTTGHIDEMLATIHAMVDDVRATQTELAELREKIRQGSEGVEGTSSAVQQIMKRSVQLQEANTFIVSIAAQTNLLAMNAAIEAAHAGESGRGFAVVAEEIRKLADQANQQSSLIGKEISGIHQEIQNTSKQTEATLELFDLVGHTISTVDHVFSRVAEGADRQGSLSDQVSAALRQLQNIVDTVHTGAGEMSNANEQILRSVTELRDRTYHTRSSIEEISTGATEINSAVNALNELSNGNRDAIAEITTRVDRFET